MNGKGTLPRLPRWLVVLGNVAIVFHVVALGVLALSAPSGPWPTKFGTSLALAPQFAGSISELTTENYLRHLVMPHNYHFDSNRCDMPSVKFEARVYDDKGEIKEVLPFPDPTANFWVRQRQHVLAQNLGGDEPYQPAQSEFIPAPGQKTRTITFFFPPSPKSERYELFEGEENQVPKEGVFRPSGWSLILARSYGDYLQRTYGGSKVEIVRLSKDALMPALLFPNPLAPGHLLLEQPRTFDTLVCSFGDTQPKRWRAK